MANTNDRKIQVNDDDKYELINLWEAEPVLYDVKHPDYRDKNKRTSATVRISEEMTIDIPAVEITKQMKNLRTQFLKEKR